jgi:hypothetical protein
MGKKEKGSILEKVNVYKSVLMYNSLYIFVHLMEKLDCWEIDPLLINVMKIMIFLCTGLM